MKHLRMVGLSLVAVFAITAIAATSASALPEWGKCEAKAGGKYLDENCTTKGSLKNPGSFEWRKGKELAPVKFTGKNVGSGGVLTTNVRECTGAPGTTGEEKRYTRKGCEEIGGEMAEGGKLTVECASEKSSGQAEGTNKISNVAVTFKGCVLGASPCTSSGAAEGEVVVKPLKGKLGYISKPAKEAGVLLEPLKKHHPFAEFTCAGFLEIVVGEGNAKEGAVYTPETTGGYDGIISPITPVNTMTTEYTQVYTVNPESENIPSKFEGKHIELLEDYAQGEGGAETLQWAKAGEEITNVNTPEEEGEIKA